MQIKNWESYQHYKSRRPIWIKLYRELLDDIEFHKLSGDEVKTLVMCWLVASEDEEMIGQLPNTEELAFRLRIDVKMLEKRLAKLSHWIIGINGASTPLATSKHPGSEIKTKRAHQLPDDWVPNDAHTELADSLSVNIEDECNRFRDHFRGNGKPMKDWDAAFRNWLRRSRDFSGQKSGSIYGN